MNEIEVYLIFREGEGYYTGKLRIFSFDNQPKIFTKLHAAKASIRVMNFKNVTIQKYQLSYLGEVR